MLHEDLKFEGGKVNLDVDGDKRKNEQMMFQIGKQFFLQRFEHYNQCKDSKKHAVHLNKFFSNN